MSDAVVTLVAGFGGALIGAGAAMGAQWLANLHGRREDRRRELVELVARFWDAADRRWRSSESLEYTILSLMNAEQSKNVEVARIYEERRQEGLANQHAAETEGLFLVAQMRLLHPAVADPAKELLAASSTFNHQQRDELRAARQAALEAYELAATRLLNRT
jgi:hypothetical protein